MNHKKHIDNNDKHLQHFIGHSRRPNFMSKRSRNLHDGDYNRRGHKYMSMGGVDTCFSDSIDNSDIYFISADPNGSFTEGRKFIQFLPTGEDF